MQFCDNECINSANIHPDNHKLALFKSLSQLYQLASVQLNILFIHSGRGPKAGKGKARFRWEASVSVMFRSKERPRKGFSVLAAQEIEREPKNERRGGERKEGKKLFQTNPRILKTPLASQRVPDCRSKSFQTKRS